MGIPRFISSDSHVFEPPDLWTARLPSVFRDRAPRIVREAGSDWWVVEGAKMTGAVAGVAGLRFERPKALSIEGTLDDVHRGGFDPAARLRDMDLDGVHADIIYPTAGFRSLALVRDTAFLNAICVAYNDYIAEFCRASPERLKGIAVVNLDDIAWAVEELARARRLGLAGVLIPAKPADDRPYSRPEYDPFWAAAQDAGMPVSLHVASDRPNPGQATTGITDFTPPSRSTLDPSVRLSLAHLIFGRVFERFPKLRVGSIEFESGWVPFFLERMDYDYTQRTNIPGWPKFRDPDLSPSDYFRRNVYVSFQQDPLGVRLRDLIGVDVLTWGSDYPHLESTFPRSRQILDSLLAECSEAEKALLVSGNAARVYGLEA
jgi:predicted TIM-barrel fold metal-dependent hydrolase